MEREWSHDEVEHGIGQFLSLSAAALATACEWISGADRGQLSLVDGARSLPEWISARFGWRHATAAPLVRVARRLEDLPRLRQKFAAGELSLDQVYAIWKLATAETEEAVISECMGLCNATLDRAARRANPPSSQDAVDAWRDGGCRSNTAWMESERGWMQIPPPPFSPTTSLGRWNSWKSPGKRRSPSSP